MAPLQLFCGLAELVLPLVYSNFWNAAVNPIQFAPWNPPTAAPHCRARRLAKRRSFLLENRISFGHSFTIGTNGPTLISMNLFCHLFVLHDAWNAVIQPMPTYSISISALADWRKTAADCRCGNKIRK
ncbi:hypothetical protein B0H14DRAFT_2834881 [Mycena olivaceomarginata]|nr:hypothetical protein B0H14DRAFT_2834881 [Mycena olivaceomarginata]